MTARLGALRDHEVAAGLDRGDRVAHLAAHRRDEHVAVVQHLDDLARHAEPGDEQRRATLHDLFRARDHALGQRGEQVHSEGRAREPADLLHLRSELVGRHRRRAERAEAACVGHGRDEPGEGHPAHSGQHDGVFDPEHLGESCAHAAHGAITVGVMTDALVGVIMGSDSDLPVMQAAIDVLDEFGVATEVRIVSAHRTPEVMVDYAKGAADRGLEVIIAGAGGAAHLPGMTASLTPLPVIGVPVPLAQLDGLDSLLSIVQMPAGIPVADGRGREREERGAARGADPRDVRRHAAARR